MGELEVDCSDISQVLGVMVKLIAPITPHLSEEIYEAAATDAGNERKSSVFLEHWNPDVRGLTAISGACSSLFCGVLTTQPDSMAGRRYRGTDGRPVGHSFAGPWPD